MKYLKPFSDTLTMLIILFVVIKVTDFAAMQALDYVLLSLFVANIALTAVLMVRRHES
jgi:hypothetical protein